MSITPAERPRETIQAMIKTLKRSRKWLYFAFLPMFGCATKTLTIKAAGAAKVNLVQPSRPDEDGLSLGETPVTLDLDRAEGRIIRVSQKGKLPVYWLVSDAVGDVTTAEIKLFDAPAAEKIDEKGNAERGESRATHNRIMRLILRSYQALTGNRLGEAKQLADQAAAIDPQLAAPHVIKGLALYQEGKAEEARTELTKAQALDPEDKDIDTLINKVR